MRPPPPGPQGPRTPHHWLPPAAPWGSAHLGVAEEAEAQHGDSREQDGPQHQRQEEKIEGSHQKVLGRHQHSAGPAVQGVPGLRAAHAAGSRALRPEDIRHGPARLPPARCPGVRPLPGRPGHHGPYNPPSCPSPGAAFPTPLILECGSRIRHPPSRGGSPSAGHSTGAWRGLPLAGRPPGSAPGRPIHHRLAARLPAIASTVSSKRVVVLCGFFFFLLLFLILIFSHKNH